MESSSVLLCCRNLDVNSAASLRVFLLDFFNSSEVKQTFKVMNTRGEWTNLAEVEEIKYQPIPTNVTHMSFIDKLEENGKITLTLTGFI